LTSLQTYEIKSKIADFTGILMNVEETTPKFGGDWTKRKLEVLEKYLNAYTQALKKQPFQLIYIDAFAGVGSIDLAHNETQQSHGLLFSYITSSKENDELRNLIDGSAKMALKIKRPFDLYYFIEIDKERCKSLDILKEEFPSLSDRIYIECGDANNKVISLCESIDWTKNRAVLFLDPLGMQVEWSTIQKIAGTKAIDLWWLFPLSAVNRMLPKDIDKVIPAWKDRLTKVFGTDTWLKAFYEKSKAIQPTLWENLRGQTTVKTGGMDCIIQYTLTRLKEVFPGVLETPPILYNSKGSPLYLFCFAVSNPSPKAQEVALKIASDIKKGF